MAETVTPHSSSIIIHSETREYEFSALPEFISQTLVETSRRRYGFTYRKWAEFAKRNGFDAFDLSFENINAFISESELAYSTRLSMKTHMLRLLDWLEESEPGSEWYVKQRRRVMKFVKIHRLPTDYGRSRSHRALNTTEVARLLAVCADDNRKIGVRNYALLRLMIYTRLRRAEVVMLRWDDIDLESQTVLVRHGKGDKERVVAIADATDNTKHSLAALHAAQAGQYNHVFPTMTAGPSPCFGTDTPMHAHGIVRLLTIAAKRASLGHLSSHDLRRTHITLALENGHSYRICKPRPDMRVPQQPYYMPCRLTPRLGANESPFDLAARA